MPPTETISKWVDDALTATPVYDLHTHLYPANFGPLMLWGIDELLTYHYLIGESVRASGIAYESFWEMSKTQQADFIWRTLFVERAPISEACRGVVTVLHRLGLDPSAKTPDGFRDYFRSVKAADYVDRVLRLANVHTVTMTNDPLDATERDIWMREPERDPRFKAVLRIDPLLLNWPAAAPVLSSMGYSVDCDLSFRCMAAVQKFLVDWVRKMDAQYVAVSLPPSWVYPPVGGEGTPHARMLDQIVLPVCRDLNLPFAMMIGVTRQANPLLRLAGDSLAKADVSSVERICAANPRNKFLCTMLSRENQHELAVAGRLFPNLMVFGCWWYVNNPSLIEEITRMRVELLGPSFVPQHSDARILDQLVYKWDHSRQVIGRVMKEKFADLAAAGWAVTKEQVGQTARAFLDNNYQSFLLRAVG